MGIIAPPTTVTGPPSLTELRAATQPVAAGEGLTNVGGFIGTPRKRIGSLTGNGVLTTFALAHNLGTQAVQIAVLTNSAGSPNEVTTVSKVVAVNTNQIEITFASAPAAGVTYWVVIEA
jgi:hypothetical protein